MGVYAYLGQKRQNEQSGFTYNQAKEILEKTVADKGEECLPYQN